MVSLDTKAKRTSLFHAATVAACGVLLLAGQSSGAIVRLWGEAYGRYGSGNTTLGQDSVSGVALAPDGDTGLHEITGAAITVGGSGHALLSQNAIAAMSGFLAASNLPGSNTNYFQAGGGGVMYLDAITVTSSTLANGTPVEIQFALQAQHVAFVDHNRAGLGEAGNYSQAKASITSAATSMSDSVYLSGGDNGLYMETKDLISTASGLFTAAQYVAYTLQAEVGKEITFSLTVDVDTYGKVSPYLPSGGTELANGVGQAYGTVAVAFGASASPVPAAGGPMPLSSGDIVLLSNILGRAFPSAASATPAAAQAAMPTNPYAPQPGDADMDGDVDLDDFVILKNNFGVGTTWGQGDFDGDLDVDLDDFVILKNNFGTTSIL